MSNLIPPPPSPQKRSTVRQTASGIVGAALMLVGIVIAVSIWVLFSLAGDRSGGIWVILVFAGPFLVLGALIWSGVFISRRRR